jgi:DNA polymerase I-like protein with 3'-5' exonuclease and polymerase domains
MSGIAIDMDLAEKVRGKMEKRLQDSIKTIQSNPKWNGLFHLTIGEGGLVPVRESGKPSISKARLEEILLQACAEITEKYQIEITLPIDTNSQQPLSPYMKEQQKIKEAQEAAKGGKLEVPKTGPKLSLSTKVWAEFAQYHDFIAAWVEMEQAAHFNSFLSHLKREDNPNVQVRAHPEYCVMVRNGRSSAQNPPIQQTPRRGGFREIFRASPGHVLVTVDYDFIELCTLAAVCLARYGHSTLANVICHGVDPHAFTASMIEGVTLEEFLTWKNSPDEELKKKFATLRQRAKAVNFGIPSGLTAAGLGHYAKSAYGVELSTEDAEAFRTTLIEKIYPELSLYLQENDMSRLATNLKIPEEICWQSFSFGKVTAKDGDFEAAKRSPAVEGGIRNIVRGRKTRKRDGKAYSAFFVKKIWNALLTLARDPETYKTLKEAKGEGSEEIFRMLFGRPVATLTGRIRGKVGFTQACNTPFSGLAADGAKLAMWNLHLLGYKIIGFIHDEIIVEIPQTPTNTYTAEVKDIQNVICQSMRELTGPIPISCSAAVSYVWSKNAKAVFDSQGEIIPWELRYDPTVED